MKNTAQPVKNIWLPVLISLPLLLIFAFPISVERRQPASPSILLDAVEFSESLQSEADSLLALFDHMPPVNLYVIDQPRSKTGTNTERGVAYTTCETNGKPVIYIKKSFYENTNRKQLENILKHELTHAWLCRQNLMSGHDELFRRKFSAVGGFGN